MKLCYRWLVCGVLATASSVFAAPPQWIIVPTESELTFTATQNDAPVSGAFKSFSGEIFVDPADYKSSRIDITVDIASIDFSYAELKNTLATPDWFNVSAYPKAEFKASQYEKVDTNTYKAMGHLTIRDKSAPVTLTFTAEQTAPNKGVVIGSTTVKRSTFGVGQGEWASTDAVKDEVTINFKVVATQKP